MGDGKMIDQSSRSSVYQPLTDYLASSRREVLIVSFDDIARLIGRPLPASAFDWPAWWSNDQSCRSQRASWRRAGYRTDGVDRAARTVVFRRAAR
jgi:hypothetical protein